jgi:hypothetical protein
MTLLILKKIFQLHTVSLTLFISAFISYFNISANVTLISKKK